MTDASDEQPSERGAEPPADTDPPEDTNPPVDGDPPEDIDGPKDTDAPTDEDREQLRREVEEKYDFEEFGPRDMAEMSYEEWEVAFDHDSWITGADLLDRVEADLKSRVADRDVFAVVERIEQDTAEQSSASNRTQSDEGEPRLLAYSDEGYAVVYPDGSVEGSGTVLRDVKPSVALSSMESYEVPEMPEGDVLPDPAEVPEGSGQLGNKLMQVVAAIHVLAGVALFVAWIAVGLPIVAVVASIGFLVFGVFVFLLVANARLSDRFRAEEYRNRLRAVGMDEDERPDFLPGEGEEEVSEDAEDSSDEGGTSTEEDSDYSGGGSDSPDDGSERPSDATPETEVSSASDGGN